MYFKNLSFYFPFDCSVLWNRYFLAVSFINVCEAGRSGSEELKKISPPSPAVLWLWMFMKENPDRKKNLDAWNLDRVKYKKPSLMAGQIRL